MDRHFVLAYFIFDPFESLYESFDFWMKWISQGTVGVCMYLLLIDQLIWSLFIKSLSLTQMIRECISILGEEVFEQVYQYLKQVHHDKINDSSLSQEEMKGLEEMLQKSNNGMLVEQLLFLEEQTNS